MPVGPTESNPVARIANDGRCRLRRGAIVEGKRNEGRVRHPDCILRETARQGQEVRPLADLHSIMMDERVPCECCVVQGEADRSCGGRSIDLRMSNKPRI